MPQGLIATALSLALYLSGVTGPSGTAPSQTGATPSVPSSSAPVATAAPAASSGAQVTSSLGSTLTVG